MFGGIVIQGENLGKQYGYPTANLDCKRGDVKLAGGVYAAHAWLRKKKYQAVLAIQEKNWKVEVHLLDYEGNDFYGVYLEAEPLQKVSEMEGFSDKNQLVEKIEEDIEKARGILGND